MPDGAVTQKMKMYGLGQHIIDAVFPPEEPESKLESSVKIYDDEDPAALFAAAAVVPASRQVEETAAAKGDEEDDAAAGIKPAAADSAQGGGLTVEEEEMVTKYKKMFKMGMPEGAVIQKMSVDEVPKHVQDAVLAPSEEPKVEEEPPKESEGPPILTAEEEEMVMKYKKMFKMGMPEGTVIQKMSVDEVPKHVQDAVLAPEEEEEAAVEAPKEDAKPTKITLSEAEEHVKTKYQKMIKMGMPEGAVVQKMNTDEVPLHIQDAVLAPEQENEAEKELTEDKEVPAPAAPSPAQAVEPVSSEIEEVNEQPGQKDDDDAYGNDGDDVYEEEYFSEEEIIDEEYVDEVEEEEVLEGSLEINEEDTNKLVTPGTAERSPETTKEATEVLVTPGTERSPETTKEATEVLVTPGKAENDYRPKENSVQVSGFVKTQEDKVLPEQKEPVEPEAPQEAPKQGMKEAPVDTFDNDIRTPMEIFHDEISLESEDEEEIVFEKDGENTPLEMEDEQEIVFEKVNGGDASYEADEELGTRTLRPQNRAPARSKTNSRSGTGRRHPDRLFHWLVFCMYVLMIGGGVAVSLYYLLYKDKSTQSSGTPTTVLAPINTGSCNFFNVTMPNTVDQCRCKGKISIIAPDVEKRYQFLLRNFVPRIYQNYNEAMSSCSVRNQALVWLSTGNDFQFSTTARSERFALANLFIGTKGWGWNNTENWLSESSACNWYGITCTNGRTGSIVLQENNLSGSVSANTGACSDPLTRRALTCLRILDSKRDSPSPATLSTVACQKFTIW